MRLGIGLPLAIERLAGSKNADKRTGSPQRGYQYESSTIMPLMVRLLNTGIQIQ
jgi:hypothetical protein